MRLIDADELKKDFDNLHLFKLWVREEIKAHIDNAPTVNPTFKPICDDAIQYTKGYQDGFLEGKKLAERPQDEFVKLLKERIVESVCEWCQMNKHCEICEISRVFMIIDLTDEERKGGAE